MSSQLISNFINALKMNSEIEKSKLFHNSSEYVL